MAKTPGKTAKTKAPAAIQAATTEVDVLIIGAGPSGLSACIKLKQQGISNLSLIHI